MPDPHRLGRSVVVNPGQSAPAAWAEVERIAVAKVDELTASVLYRAWLRRQPMVIELAPGIGLDDPTTPPPERVSGLQPWEWPVSLDLAGARMHHAVWANASDARSGAAPVFRWAEAAVRLGAQPSTQPDAEVVLPDGTVAVCDGGPLDASLAGRLGTAVVHRVSLEHGSLNPLGRPDVSRLDGQLAADQLAAVVETSAGARVIAPAGSGKTRVLTERARSLIHDWGVPPAALALVAYNVRAAGEMRERLGDVAGLRIRTLNALGLRLCGRSETVDEPAVRRILADLVSFPRRAETDPAAPWLEAFGRLRLGLTPPPVVEEELPDVSDLDRVARAYRAELADRDAVDFDEQVVGAIEHLLDDPEFRVRSQRFARVLLVDEFQDLTPAHLLLLRLLAGPAGAVFGVGDDDQTIYGYAGATPRWLVDFEEWFPGSATHSLGVNYRCPPAVVNAAANLLTRNRLRVSKEIRPGGQADDPGALDILDPGVGPAVRSAARVATLIRAGARPGDVAVLTRVNASLVPVQVLLRHQGIAINPTRDSRFLARSGVRGALAWLEVATADASLPASALRDAARRPKRGMSNSLLDLIARPRKADSLDGLARWLEDKGSGREAEKVDQLSADIALVRQIASRGTTAEVLAAVRSKIGGGGLDSSAAALDQWSHGTIAAHLDDLEALSELAGLETDPRRFAGWLAEHLTAEADPAGVTLASIHAVKGREWPHVVLHHVTDGLLPHRLAEDVEEERRVFHVGLTRAAASVTVVPGPVASPFLSELTEAGAPPIPPGPNSHRPATTRARAATYTGSADPNPTGAPATLLPAQPGTHFDGGGHDMEIVEAGPDGVQALIGGGPARTFTPYGTSVTWSGRGAILAHPNAELAWDRLRAWRAERSKAANVPAYVVFDDRTLRTVAARLPATEAGLASIRGIGPVKLDSYGSELIALAEELRAIGTEDEED